MRGRQRVTHLGGVHRMAWQVESDITAHGRRKKRVNIYIRYEFRVHY